MKWIILSSFLITTIIIFTLIFNRLFFSQRRFETRVKDYLLSDKEEILEKKNFNLMVQIQLINEKFKNQLPSIKSNEKLETLLNRAGLSLEPEEFIFFRWMGAIFFGSLLYIFSENILFFIVGGFWGYVFPKLILKRRFHKRLSKFNEGLPDMITIIVGSLRAGFSFPQSLKSVVEESDSPIKEEISLVLKEMQYGGNIEEALYNLQERMPSGDLELMVQAILIQRQVGGNLATVLDIIIQTIRDRNTIQRQVITLTAQGRLSGLIIGLLPIILSFAIYFINPDYISILFKERIGLIMVGMGIFSALIGFILIRKITIIEV
ncbi:MAG: type II secretion system F family protein [Anaeromicrobium sp.]|jgi:tight adherence protein B|uniref:type II secretion system F family protein n=1 Tax=Anaeromicrobium sp. TaxID=1929132 RepID=UPI0025E74450|nr:type II secretion system F family protein [Anaeromicrobium sp.]MCT4595103.1 type II secretion system F family protein [Anaeromicrobium sp.]